MHQFCEKWHKLIDALQDSNLAAASGILAGLVLDKQMIRRALRRELMEESVIYQELREEARQEVRQEERLEGERSLILRQLTRRVEELTQQVRSQIEALSI